MIFERRETQAAESHIYLTFSPRALSKSLRGSDSREQEPSRKKQSYWGKKAEFSFGASKVVRTKSLRRGNHRGVKNCEYHLSNYPMVGINKAGLSKNPAGKSKLVVAELSRDFSSCVRPRSPRRSKGKGH